LQVTGFPFADLSPYSLLLSSFCLLPSAIPVPHSEFRIRLVVCFTRWFCQYERIEKSTPLSSSLLNCVLAGLAAAVVFLSLCFRLGHLPLMAPDEGRNAEVGREMKESGAWLVPTYNGVDYLDKPAFYFKAVALSLAAFGNNETAARLPSAVFGVGLVLLVFAFCRKVYGTRCGLLAAIVVAATPLFLANARTVIFDIALAFFVCAAIFAGYLAETVEGKARTGWYLLGAASAGFATLVKGPVGFLIPALVLLVFNRVAGRRGAWRRLLAPLNLLLFFAVTLPWFVGLCLVHRDFLQYGLIEESFHRFTSAKTFHRSEPVYFYLLIVASTFFPWSLLLPEASLAMWRERWLKHDADRLGLVWSVVVILFFSISQSKLPGYILSVTISCGMLVARLWDAALTVPGGRAARLAGHATALFAMVCLLIATAAFLGMGQMSVLAQPLDISVADTGNLGNAVRPLAILLMIFGGCGLLAWYWRNIPLSFLCLALFTPLSANVGLGVFDVIYEAKSGRRIANQLSTLSPQTELACLRCFPNGLPFYLGRTATLISHDGDELTSNYITYALSKNPQWPEQIVRLTDLDRWVASRTNPVYFIVRQSDLGKLGSLAGARIASVQSLPSDYLGVQLSILRGP
jgi:4-amino-4-deoxy-L-arabinose transferase-like glycosyltransferase